MLFSKVSMFSGKTNHRELPITEEDYKLWKESHQLIQHFFPQLSSDDREFLMTGTTPEEWDEYMGDEE